MRRLKNKGNARPQTCIDQLVEKVRGLSGGSSIEELFLRATLVCRKKLAYKKAKAALTRFLKDSCLVHWVRRIFHKVVQGDLVLPELKFNTV